MRGLVRVRRMRRGHGRRVEWRGHEGEDCVKGDGTEKSEAIDVSEMDFAAKEEEGAKEEEEEDGASQVGVVHNVLVDAGKRVEYC
jgi:hypothetical protein